MLTIPSPKKHLLENMGTSKKFKVYFSPYHEQFRKEDDSWWRIFGLSLIIGAVFLFTSFLLRRPVFHVILVYLFHAFIGAYFCLIASSLYVPSQLKKQSPYTQPSFSLFHVRGSRLFSKFINQQNWPYVLRTIRISTCVIIAIYPIVDLIAQTFFSHAWPVDTAPYFQNLLFCEIVLIYVVAKTYE